MRAVALLLALASATAFTGPWQRSPVRSARPGWLSMKPSRISSTSSSSSSTSSSQISASSAPRSKTIIRDMAIELDAPEDVEISDKPWAGMRVVMKFGGSSLADTSRLEHVAALVADQRATYGIKPIMVCSAMGKTTNNLLEAGEFAYKDGKVFVDTIRNHHMKTCDEIGVSDEVRAEIVELLNELERLLSGITFLKELTPRTKDLLVSFGERMSVRLMAAQLNKIGLRGQAFDSWALGLRTDSEFGNAEIDPSSYDVIKGNVARLDDDVIPIVTGFIAQDHNGAITTLGRGGSDLSAAVLAAACDLDEIQVWKDVDGMLTADPRVVPGAVPVPAVTYEEASELAYFGAKILHPISMQPAMKKNIPVRIKNSYNPEHPGTVITRTAKRDESSLVTAITTKRHQILLDLVSTRMLGQHGFLAKVFDIFERRSVSVDMIATSEVSVSLTFDEAQRAKAEKVVEDLIKAEVAEVKMSDNRSIIALIANVGKSSDVMAGVFSILAKENVQVEMLSQGASKVNISVVVKDSDLDKALSAIHKHFFE